MRLTMLRSVCPDTHTCPTLWATDRDTAVIQGDRAGEGAVTIPRSLLTGRDEPGTITIHGETVTDPEALAVLNLPAHESAVEVPLDHLGAS